MAGEISGNLAGGIRKMATHGRSVPEIATYYDLDPAAVRRFLRTPLSKDRWAKGTARPIIAQTATRVRAMIDRGSSDADIAAHLELDPERVRDFRKRLEPVRRNRLTRLRGRTEQERLEQNQSKLPLPKPRRPPDAWKLAAQEDPRFRDPVSTLEAPAAAQICAGELVNQASAELAPSPSPDPPRPIAESWGSVYASGPRKMTADVLAEAKLLRESGWSWPAIAQKFGCHRMTFYHALRRPPR
jgi:hypothetical protein